MTTDPKSPAADPKTPDAPLALAVPVNVSDTLSALKASLLAIQNAKTGALASKKSVLDALSAWEKTMPAKVKPVLAKHMTALRNLGRVGQGDNGPWLNLLTDLQAAIAAVPAIEAALMPVINDIVAIIQQGV